MKFFREKTTGEVYAFSKEQIKKYLVSNSMFEMSESEVREHLKPIIKKEQEREMLQDKKDSLLAYATMKIDIINDAINFGINVNSNKKNILNWREYRVKLDSIDVSLGDDIIWPEFHE
ncbi:TPA: tail fiber assembly protein [Morganella morganii subsp. morganii]|nr:tail fiber assembly protein [Morganella morganii subsp. morganii]